MQSPLRISFHELEPSPAIEDRIRREVDKLERFHPNVVGCHVTVSETHHHHHKGNIYGVRVEVAVPGEDVVISREPEVNHAHDDPYVSIRDAFDAARRKLEDHARRMRGDVKTHEEPSRGRVIRLVPEDQYGFLETDDALQVYFHEHAVARGRFGELQLGDEVRFVLAEGEGEKGPQASTVVLERHPRGPREVSPAR
ncbi:HPF/RaiA family ribosome-associated protein [Sandaracinus amylolyticus]|uniref:Sigma 54 modulation protein YhbH n=1 Tax=Sandaracinus amylolyticus TaxID=927083 RepID=A0A0F6VYM2_9BACT|nr:HPF/RaiA family ribosome-associated protein [Sandaracinus amylolyticus]AKF02943.1 Sigma 54 modulation protein YhbH [Sandaracinus amylolyticus]